MSELLNFILNHEEPFKRYWTRLLPLRSW